jgi:uncharacterized protein
MKWEAAMSATRLTSPPLPVTRRHGAGWLRARPLLAFFALVYALSWPLWLLALNTEGAGATAAEYGALFGPALAAALVAWRTGRLREWAGGIVRWRVPARWWAVALGLPVAFAAVVHLVFALAGIDAVDLSLLPAQAISYLPVLVVLTIVGGGLNEEPAWRGFALPQLQERLSALRATLVLGTAWAVWHLPSFAFPEIRNGLELGQFGFLAAGALVEVVAWAFVFTWLYNHTASTLLCIVLHGGINAAFASLLLPAAALTDSVYLQVALIGNAVVAAGALALIVATRGRLGQKAASTDA